MWKLPTTVLVILVTAVNAWVNWHLWQRGSEPAGKNVLPPALAPKQPGVKARAIGQREIFRPRRAVVVAARPPWSELESEDYAEYARNLRRVGCPEKTVRDILVADISHTLREQLRELERNLAGGFWQTADQRGDLARRRLRRSWELRLRKWDLLRELFQYPVDEEVLKVARDDGLVGGTVMLLFGFLDRENFLKAAGAGTYYLRQLEAIHAVTEGILLESDYARGRQIREQMEASLTSLVGAENVREVLLRMVAAEMDETRPSSEHGLELSGTELRQLMGIHLAARDMFSEVIVKAGFRDLKPSVVPPDEIDTAVARFLGPDRFTDYLRAKDERFHDIYIFATENGLAKKEAGVVFEERVRAEDELKRLREAKDLSAEEMVLLQAALKSRVEGTIRRVFGPIIGDEYLGDGGSSWINAMINIPEEKPEAAR